MLRTAARVARTFGMDPVAVADEPDMFLWAFRIAAHNSLMTDDRQAAKEASGK